MNDYYHVVQIGFNVWYLALPFFLLVMGFLGSRRFYLDPENKRIRRKGKYFTIVTSITEILLEAVLIILVIKESSAGILQVSANHIDGDVRYAFLVAFIFQTAMFILFYLLLCKAERVGEDASLGHLIELRHNMKKEVQIVIESEAEDPDVVISFPTQED